MYIYHTTIFTDLTNVVGAPASSASDKSDFEINYKASTYPITDIQIAETSMEVEKTYSQFKALVASPILWTDVKRIDDTNHYDLYLLSENPL